MNTQTERDIAVTKSGQPEGRRTHTDPNIVNRCERKRRGDLQYELGLPADKYVRKVGAMVYVFGGVQSEIDGEYGVPPTRPAGGG